MNTVSRPLASTQPSGAARLFLPTTGNTIDPIQLHADAHDLADAPDVALAPVLRNEHAAAG